MIKKLTLAFVIAAILPLNVVSQSSSQGQFTLKTSTEVVLVNVTVRDKNDNFIKDLKQQDFTILEDGKKQDVVSMDVENTDSVVSAEAPTTELLNKLNPVPGPTVGAPPPRPAPSDVNELKDRRLIVLFFD